MSEWQDVPAAAGGASGGARQQNPPQNQLMTIALKPDTYRELAELKSKYKFRSFDDVVRLLLESFKERL